MRYHNIRTVVEQAGESPARGDLPIRKKKHLQSHGIFQLAETVERREARWDDAQWRQNLQVSGWYYERTRIIVTWYIYRIASFPNLKLGPSCPLPRRGSYRHRVLPWPYLLRSLLSHRESLRSCQRKDRESVPSPSSAVVNPSPSSSYTLQSPRGTTVTGLPLPGPSPLAQSGTVPQNPPPGPRPESPTAFPHHAQLQVPDAPNSLSVPSVPIPSTPEDIQMFEALALSSSSGSDDTEGENVGKRRKKFRNSIKPGPMQESQDIIPDEVAAFLPMLEEYLKCKPQESGLHRCSL